MPELKGLATLIGSFPHKEADEALELIFKYTPEIPCWPQLPKRDFREGMVAQFSQGFPCIRVSKDALYLDETDKDKELERFYEDVITKDTSDFKITQDFALGLHKFYQKLENSDLSAIEYIKCQVTGPFTFAASINDSAGKSILHNEIFFQVVLKGLSMKALWQIELFKKFGKKIILFFDEPYLSCFGSAFTALNREKAVRDLRELVSSVKSPEVLVGVHCCGNTDWSIFTDVEGIDIINFDAYNFLDKVILYSQDIGKFLERGGRLCWGVVPTQEFSDKITKQTLLDKIQAGINAFKSKGVREDLLMKRMLISPACGLGSLEPGKTEAILRLLAEFSPKMRQKEII